MYSRDPKEWTQKQLLINEIANYMSLCGPLKKDNSGEHTYVFGYGIIKARGIIEDMLKDYELKLV